MLVASAIRHNGSCLRIALGPGPTLHGLYGQLELVHFAAYDLSHVDWHTKLVVSSCSFVQYTCTCTLLRKAHNGSVAPNTCQEYPVQYSHMVLIVVQRTVQNNSLNSLA